MGGTGSATTRREERRAFRTEWDSGPRADPSARVLRRRLEHWCQHSSPGVRVRPKVAIDLGARILVVAAPMECWPWAHLWREAMAEFGNDSRSGDGPAVGLPTMRSHPYRQSCTRAASCRTSALRESSESSSGTSPKAGQFPSSRTVRIASCTLAIALNRLMSSSDK